MPWGRPEGFPRTAFALFGVGIGIGIGFAIDFQNTPTAIPIPIPKKINGLAASHAYHACHAKQLQKLCGIGLAAGAYFSKCDIPQAWNVRGGNFGEIPD
jgi:hypothetical protein